MHINVKSLLACLAAILLFTVALYLAIRYLVSFYKIFAIVLLIIGLSHGLAGILIKKGDPSYEQ